MIAPSATVVANQADPGVAWASGPTAPGGGLVVRVEDRSAAAATVFEQRMASPVPGPDSAVPPDRARAHAPSRERR